MSPSPLPLPDAEVHARMADGFAITSTYEPSHKPVLGLCPCVACAAGVSVAGVPAPPQVVRVGPVRVDPNRHPELAAIDRAGRAEVRRG